MSNEETVEVATKGPSYTIVGGGSDPGPWWMRFLMQAGFMGILVLVLWGAYDLFKTKLPTLVEPVDNLAASVAVLEERSEDSTNAQIKQAEALAKVAEAQLKSSEAQAKQAAAIERWVNQQTFRITERGVFGPPKERETP